MNSERIAEQRRALRTLSLTQVAIGVGVTSFAAVGALLIDKMLGYEGWGGLAGTATAFGAAVGAAVLARIASSSGRRIALGLGAGIGAAGGAAAAIAADISLLPLFLLGGFGLGIGNAAGLQSRYAAADLATAENRARSVATVVWATTVGAVTGPLLIGPLTPLARALNLPDLAGPLVGGAIAFTIAAAWVFVALRPDPLETAARWAAEDQAEAARLAASTSTGDEPVPAAPPIGGIAALWSNRNSKIAVLGLAVAQATMVGVMTMTPGHLKHGTATNALIGGVISAHVAGMYATSPLWGWVADRIGRLQTVALGAAVLLVSMVLSAAADPNAHALLFVALFLLGLGWSITLVAASSLLSESVDASVRVRAQGAADSLTMATSATAALLSGQVVSEFGYPTLSLAGVALATVTLAVAATEAVRRARPATAGA